MNALIPSYYREDTYDSIQDTKDIINAISRMNSKLIKPIITPRFVLSCDMHLMTELAKIAKENNLHIQVIIFKLTTQKFLNNKLIIFVFE